jgi:carboxyl-terminal processing protease
MAKQFADGRGHYKNIPLVVMIDESSASAAEIFTGAIQDNDRGTIVGRRSFGKGLVQEPIDFNDGSSIRITIARYYTPSGRCIQKPYGDSDEDYAMDIVKRYEHGEFFSADSIKQNEDEVYTTKGGRTVYGGGGIMPDVFVAQDTTGYSTYYSNVVRKSLINQYSFKYVDSRRSDFAGLKTYADVENYLDADNVLTKFYDYAAKNGVKRNHSLSAPARKQMRTALYGNIIYDALDMQDYISFINLSDPAVTKAVEILK